MRHDLTPKQDRFCREYVIDLNGTRAAQAAGSTAKSAPVTASRWLKLTKVQARISELANASAERVARELEDAEHTLRSERLQDYVVRNLREVADRAMIARPVLDKEGNPIGVYTYDGMVACRALELIGKHLGMFKDVIERHDKTIEQVLRELVREEQEPAVTRHPWTGEPGPRLEVARG